MTDRFGRAKTRLENHERGVQRKRDLDKRLGRVRPEETVKIPKIGEWNLTTQTYDRETPVKTDREKSKSAMAITKDQLGTRSVRDVHPFPSDVPLTAEQQQRLAKPDIELVVTSPHKRNTQYDPPFILKPPAAVTEALTHGSSRKAFAPGTTTTDLNAILKSKYIAPSKPLPPLKDRVVAPEEIGKGLGKKMICYIL